MVEEIEPDPDAEPDREYPLFEFDGEGIGPDGSVHLERELERTALTEWLHRMAEGVNSHEFGFEADDGYLTLGLHPGDVRFDFDPDEVYRGELTVTVRMDAAIMKYTDDPDRPKLGARGGGGFIPLKMLTSDRDPSEFRCYNWVDDPINE